MEVGTNDRLGSELRGNWVLWSHLPADAGLLQQVLLYLGSLDGSSLVEVDVDVLPEAGRVVVPDRLGVPERCRCRIRNSGFIVLMCC